MGGDVPMGMGMLTLPYLDVDDDDDICKSKTARHKNGNTVKRFYRGDGSMSYRVVYHKDGRTSETRYDKDGGESKTVYHKNGRIAMTSVHCPSGGGSAYYNDEDGNFVKHELYGGTKNLDGGVASGEDDDGGSDGRCPAAAAARSA